MTRAHEREITTSATRASNLFLSLSLSLSRAPKRLPESDEAPGSTAAETLQPQAIALRTPLLGPARRCCRSWRGARSPLPRRKKPEHRGRRPRSTSRRCRPTRTKSYRSAPELAPPTQRSRARRRADGDGRSVINHSCARILSDRRRRAARQLARSRVGTRTDRRADPCVRIEDECAPLKVTQNVAPRKQNAPRDLLRFFSRQAAVAS